MGQMQFSSWKYVVCKHNFMRYESKSMFVLWDYQYSVVVFMLIILKYQYIYLKYQEAIFYLSKFVHSEIINNNMILRSFHLPYFITFPLTSWMVYWNRLKDQRERALQRFEEEKDLASRKLLDFKNRLESLQSELTERQVSNLVLCFWDMDFLLIRSFGCVNKWTLVSSLPRCLFVGCKHQNKILNNFRC